MSLGLLDEEVLDFRVVLVEGEGFLTRVSSFDDLGDRVDVNKSSCSRAVRLSASVSGNADVVE